jgi:hypothetical protein
MYEKGKLLDAIKCFSKLFISDPIICDALENLERTRGSREYGGK